ncbi:hypothetical protein B1757_13430 [Acidithiobacillus marinus]|uniref:Uncharacterized protein n=1 Tax=Acidithiobacillus marinus TaxID=187490 RepID=A0A2I1DIL4_9PROT|nr:hypothetical protein [Acidithiobacillus marinus]PKY09724.1 hypothetical protein B1757_13430 [Acidithiobacillus marinus]
MEARQHVVKLETLKDVNDVLTDSNISVITKEEHRKIAQNAAHRNNLSRLIQLIADERLMGSQRIRAINDLARMREQIAHNNPPQENRMPAEHAYAPEKTQDAPRKDAIIIAMDNIEDDDMRYINHTAYGAKAAFVVAMSKTKPRPNEDLQGHYTVNIEAAKIVEGAERKYDWSDKITLQLTRAELPTVAAVFYGYMDACTFASHGPAKDKGFSLERKDGGIIARVNATGKSMAVKISPPDIFQMGAILTRQLLKETPWMDSYMLEKLLRGSFTFQTSQAMPAPQPARANAPANNAQHGPKDKQCAGCGCEIDQRVHDYSLKNMGRPLCLNCQKKH